MDEQIQAVSSNSSKNTPIFVVLGVVGVVAVAAVAFFFINMPKKSPVGTTMPITGEAPTPNPTLVQAQIKGEEVSIFVTPAGFIPQDLTIKAGANVTWYNRSGVKVNVSSAPHPAHSEYPALNLGDFDVTGQVALTFAKPGVYKYHNHLSPSQFGTITVL